MLNQPSDNIVLTFEQQQQVETAKKWLNNLQNETTIAVAKLTEVRADSDRIVKEKAYQDDLLKSVTEKVKELQARHDVLLANLETGNTILSDNAAKAAAITADSEARLVAVKAKEDALQVAIKEHEANVKAHAIKGNELDARAERINQAYTRLASVLDEIKL